MALACRSGYASRSPVMLFGGSGGVDAGRSGEEGMRGEVFNRRMDGRMGERLSGDLSGEGGAEKEETGVKSRATTMGSERCMIGEREVVRPLT